MIKIDKVEIAGWGPSIRGMRNPMQSWDKSDSYAAVNCPECGIIEREGHCIPKEHKECYKYIGYEVGTNDKTLMNSLATAGTDHSKFARMLTVWCDITAPLYWWKEFDTYRVGVEKNSSSTMHTIHMREFTLDDFSHEHLFAGERSENGNLYVEDSLDVLERVIFMLNYYRKEFLESKDKQAWWQMIQLLPSSYNQLRTVQMSYQAISKMYFARRNHKLDCWREFCKWAETLPYFKEIYLEG